MNTINDIKNAVEIVTGKRIEDYDKNLLHVDFGIEIIDFLYIIDILEQKGYHIIEAMVNNEYTVFSINNLSKAMSAYHL